MSQPDEMARVEIDPRRLGLEGSRFLGEVEALSRWGDRFATIAQGCLDLRERQVLLEVAKALLEDAELKKMLLVRIASRRHAAVITKNDEDDTPHEAA